MEKNKDVRIAVKRTGSTPLGTHLVDEVPIAVLDRHTSAFVSALAQSLGMSESWVLDFIIETYATKFGFNHPNAD